MFSLRLLSRAVPKSTFRTTTLRSLSYTSRPTLIRSSWQTVKKPAYPAFSTSICRKEPAADSDQELAAKFGLERELELDSSDPSQAPANIEDFLQNSSFKLQDTPGSHEVVLTKTFGNETIKIEFSVAEMGQMEDEFDGMEEDPALEDEEFMNETPKKTINQSGVRGGKVDVAPEDSIAPADRAEGEVDGEEDLGPSLPLSFQITITKPGNKAIEVRAVADDGTVEIESVNFFPKAQLLEAKNAEDAAEARSLYVGPPFRNLDPDLQAMFETYLDERGINAQLASFLPEYVEFKEQREYVQWLENMKSFIEA